MDYHDLEDELIEAIRRCCPTENDKEEAKRYFADYLINNLIDEALQE